MPPKGKGKGKGGGAPGGKAVIVEAVVEQDPEKFILNLLKKLLPDVGGEELELGEWTNQPLLSSRKTNCLAQLHCSARVL